MKMKWWEWIIVWMLVFVIIFTITATLRRYFEMNSLLFVRTVGFFGSTVFALLSAFAHKLLRKEQLAIKLAAGAIPFFVMFAIINDW